MRVIDLGAGDGPDPRATETVDLYTDADHQFDLSQRWELNDSSVDGLIANHVVEHLDAEHVFKEAGRVLVDGGWFELTVPLGRDADADPDHQQRWTYWTPRMFCQRSQDDAGRPWDPDTEFVLDDRELSVWLFGPLAPLSGLFDLLADRWPHWAERRCGAGELTARYRRVS